MCADPRTTRPRRPVIRFDKDVAEPGDIIDGKYRVVRLLGEGGMGAVFEGLNMRLGRPVAIKMMHAEIARDKQAVARFEREAQAAARIGSRHIVDVLDLGELASGDRYLVMEYLDGETLAARLKRAGTMGVPEAARFGVQLVEGLAKVHDAGIVHRDLKPPNVFLVPAEDGSDFVKILDFGVCKIQRSIARNGPSTGVGDVLGTLGYMAPEQLEHGPQAVDARADLYAVGVLLYRAVAGCLPYPARNLPEHLTALRERRTSPLVELVKGTDPRFSEIVERAIEWDRDARFQDARELLLALSTFCQANDEVNRLLADFLERDAATTQVRARNEATASSGQRTQTKSPGEPWPAATGEPTRQGGAPIEAESPRPSRLPKVSPPPRDRRAPQSSLPPPREPMPSLSDIATGKLPAPRPAPSEIEIEVDIEDTGRRR